MKTTRPSWPLLIAVVLAMGLLATGTFTPSSRPAAYAQRPTPTDIPLDQEEPGAEKLPGSTVRGIVFNYSASQPQGGIGVVLEGDGWTTETVSEADGRYTFRGLGKGSATLRLRLPEGATPVNPDLPVYTDDASDLTVNLGYYTGAPSPVPVLLSAEYAPVEGAPDQLVLNLQVENRWIGDATGVFVDAQLPVGQQIISAQVSQGWADAVGLRAQVHLGNLAKGQKANINLLLNLTSPEASGKVARATLTCDQQVTSQIVDVMASQPELPVTGEARAQDSLSFSLLAALLVTVFGCATVLIAKVKVRERDL